MHLPMRGREDEEVHKTIGGFRALGSIPGSVPKLLNDFRHSVLWALFPLCDMAVGLGDLKIIANC